MIYDSERVVWPDRLRWDEGSGGFREAKGLSDTISISKRST